MQARGGGNIPSRSQVTMDSTNGAQIVQLAQRVAQLSTARKCNSQHFRYTSQMRDPTERVCATDIGDRCSLLLHYA